MQEVVLWHSQMTSDSIIKDRLRDAAIERITKRVFMPPEIISHKQFENTILQQCLRIADHYRNLIMHGDATNMISPRLIIRGVVTGRTERHPATYGDGAFVNFSHTTYVDPIRIITIPQHRLSYTRQSTWSLLRDPRIAQLYAQEEHQQAITAVLYLCERIWGKSSSEPHGSDEQARYRASQVMDRIMSGASTVSMELTYLNGHLDL